MTDKLLEVEWREIIGCTPEHLGKDFEVEDAAVLGNLPGPVTQAEALLHLMNGERKPLVATPDFGKMSPIAAEPDQEEAVSQLGALQKISLGLPPFQMPIKKTLTAAEEAACDEILNNLPVRDLSGLLVRLKKFADKRNKPGVSALVSRMIEVEEAA